MEAVGLGMLAPEALLPAFRTAVASGRRDLVLADLRLPVFLAVNTSKGAWPLVAGLTADESAPQPSDEPADPPTPPSEAESGDDTEEEVVPAVDHLQLQADIRRLAGEVIDDGMLTEGGAFVPGGRGSRAGANACRRAPRWECQTIQCSSALGVHTPSHGAG